MTDGHGERRALRATVKGALGAGLLALIAMPGGPAQAAWDGTQELKLGDKVAADFAKNPGEETHHYGFYAPDLAKISAKAKNAKGLATIVGLHGGYRADTENVEVAPTAAGLSNYVVPRRGLYHVNVASTQGVGTYTLQTKAVYNKKLSGTATLATSNNVTTGTFKFGGVAGMKVSGTVKAATATISITKVAGPVNEVTYPTKAKNRDFPANLTSFRNLVLLEDGEFQITIATNSSTEPVTVDLTFTAPKPAPRSYAFPAMDAPRGDPESIREKWLESGHANLGEEAFKHWTGSVPDAVPTSCAKCHSSSALADYLADGTVNTAPRTGSSVDCQTCHSDLAAGITAVKFPSGLSITGVGPEGRCMECHQGRESTKSVDTAIGSTEPDSTSNTALGFKNVHYFAAAATLYGREVEGAYEYADPAYVTSTVKDPTTGLTQRLPYDRRFAHVGAADTCLGCHDQHTLERKIDFCNDCHVAEDGQPVANDDDLREIRMAGTTEDYDGDGNHEEGTYYELEGMANVLYGAIRDYAQNTLGKGIAYDGHSYPYYFTDANNDGQPDVNPTTGAKIGYSPWSPRLLRAAYNYQYWQKDPGAFAHNAKYVMEVLYDSIADIHSVRPVGNFANLVRNDRTHFDSSAEAYRDWDAEATLLGATPAACSRCHSTEGFRYHIANQAERNQPYTAPLNSGMICESCHVDGANFAPGATPKLVYVAKTVFPYVDQSTSTSNSTAAPSTGSQIAGVTITNAPETGGAVPADSSFICMTCHQGRNSKLTYDGYLATSFATTNPQRLRFQNVHYLIAGATQYSTKAAVHYPWTGIADTASTPFPASRSYQTAWTHTAETAWVPYASGNAASGMPSTAQCVYCHLQETNRHTFMPEAGEDCTVCHTGTDVTAYRKGNGVNGGSAMSTDFDGNAATTKLSEEVESFKAALLAAMNTYAASKSKLYFVYDGHTNPYWFASAANDGTADDIHGTNPSSSSPNNTGPDGVVNSNDAYDQFDRFLLFAAHNYQCVEKDPGAWAHNGRFVLQILYDSIDYLDNGLWDGSPKNLTTNNPLVRPVRNF